MGDLNIPVSTFSTDRKLRQSKSSKPRFFSSVALQQVAMATHPRSAELV
jgi:hypothetical protein